MRAPDVHAAPASAAPAVGLASFAGTLAGVVLLIGLLLTFDLFLAHIDLQESTHHAADEYRDGLALLAAHQPSSAAEHFAAALAIDRQNVNYALALGEAQRRDGKTQEAEATLKAPLERAENDGAINLAMAHVLEDEGRVAESKVYFHRAVYGRWGPDSLARRAEARFALIDLLAAHGGGRDLLAELLPLEDVSPDSLALRKRLGRWFLEADSPARAANMFREVLHRDPTDGEAFAGMGEAALAESNFRTARADFAQALTLMPADTGIAGRLALVDTLLAADPTARGLAPSERVARGRALLGRMLAVTAPCVRQTPRPVIDASRAAVADTGRSTLDADERADSVLALAATLWSSCSSDTSDSVVRLLALRISR